MNVQQPHVYFGIGTIDDYGSHCIRYHADAADLVRLRAFAKTISEKLPAEDGGSRFARVFDQSKKHKLHDFFLFAGGLGAYMAHLMRAIGPRERTAYTLLYLVCGELWEKVIYK